ncbi:diguanylate cyclase [Escherichia coli]|uniref:Diguanylate cyclase n=1 Tax=Escherichia coli TaxID=562 RepID=A0A376TUS1_ECOLX|nr:diguanylate cyclase [Escherichia coli]
MMCVPTAIFSRRVSEERIAEFHRFALDFNSLLDEMEEWQLRLQAKNAQLLAYRAT